MKSVDDKAKIFELERENALLKKEIEVLRGIISHKFPPYQTPDTKWPLKQCPKCAISLEGTMCYSCPNKDCPTGMGSIWSGVSE